MRRPVLLLILVLAVAPARGAAPKPLDFSLWFPKDARLSARIPADAQTDPLSPAMVASIVQSAQEHHGLPIDVKQWSVPVYYAAPGTPRQDVTLTYDDGRKMRAVPIPANAVPDPEGDGHMAVIDRATGCVFEFYEAQRRPDGSWQAGVGNSVNVLKGPGVYTDGGTRASGFSVLAGLIRPEELRRGWIGHALAASHSNTKAGGPVYPATQSDGRHTGDSAIPEGARLQLDPSFDVKTLAVRWQRVIARAMQVYGMYIVDTGGNFGFWAQNPQSYGHSPYPWGEEPYVFMPPELAAHIRVLKLPLQRQPKSRRGQHCAAIR